MKQEISPPEREDLKKAIISAFPSPGALEQMVDFKLGEILHAIAGGKNYSEIVFSLIKWAEANDKIEELISSARRENPGNSKLRKFEAQYKLRRSTLNDTNAPQVHLSVQLRLDLIGILVTLCAKSSYQARSVLLLGGIPGSHVLTRSETNVYEDIAEIIDQLDQRGRLSSGTWPLLILIDNVLLQIGDYTISDHLRGIRQVLVQQYESGED